MVDSGYQIAKDVVYLEMRIASLEERMKHLESTKGGQKNSDNKETTDND